MEEPSIDSTLYKLRQIFDQQGLTAGSCGISPALGFSSEVAFDLFVSGAVYYAVNDDASVKRWVDDRLVNSRLTHEIIPLREIEKWYVDGPSGNISHESGRFFSIMGLKVRHRCKSEEIFWDQPVIDQPEVGILGILTKKIHGVLHFCLQAKEEPGNVHLVQLSPTVQATYSNYTCAHGGKMPPFIELFLDPPKERVLFSKLQAEDGGRFLHKSNKNMIVVVQDNEVPDLPEDFIWLTLRQIRHWLERDNMVNSCARSVLACLI